MRLAGGAADAIPESPSISVRGDEGGDAFFLPFRSTGVVGDGEVSRLMMSIVISRATIQNMMDDMKSHFS